MSQEDYNRAMQRYAAVSAVLVRQLAGHSLANSVSDIHDEGIVATNGELIRPSRRSLYRWIGLYQSGGIEALKDESRKSSEPSRVLSDRFLDFMRHEKDRDEELSIPDLIKLSKAKQIIAKAPSRSTVWRAAVKMNLPIFAGKSPAYNTMRPFAYAHRMTMVLADGKHFRAGSARRKRVAVVFLDDATRLALAGVVGYSESAELFLRGYWKAITNWGIMNSLYLDKGPAHISSQVARISARLKVNLIHGKTRYPEGHGKIERFNRTMKKELLRGFDGNPEIDPNLAALELRLDHYLKEVYNRTPHDALGHITPESRFLADTLSLRVPDDLAALRQKFIIVERRRVKRHNVVSLGGTYYEMPLGYAGLYVDLYRHLLDKTVSCLHQGKMIQLAPPDLDLNARTAWQRAALSKPKKSQCQPVTTAASVSFHNDHKPIVSPGGDFHDQES